MEKIWLSFFPIDNDNAVFYAEVPKGLFSEGMVLALGRDHTLMLYRKLFEMLVLEGMQAGLSWLTILNKRAAFKEAFNEFDYQKIALYDETKIDELMQNPNIVRNRLKIKSTITNAQQFIKIQEEYGSFDKFIWSYVKNRPIHNHFKSEADIPATTPLSDRISKDLKKRGFKFVGSTIIYAYMQAIGIVNDHVKGCYLYVPE